MQGRLDIIADSQGRKHRREMELPYDIEVSSAKSTYSNAILQIVFKVRPASEGTRVRID